MRLDSVQNATKIEAVTNQNLMHFLLLLQIPLQTQRPNCADHNREVGLGPNEGKIDDVLGPSLVKQEQEEEELQLAV